MDKRRIMTKTPALVSLGLAALVAGCGDTATLTVSDGTGPTPRLPPPNRTLLPTVHIAPAQGWRDGARPAPGDGVAVSAYASGLDHPRWLHVLPNGDVLVAESNAPPQARGRPGHPRLGHGAGDEAGRRRRAERQPHHPAARRRRRRHGRGADACSSTSLNSPFGMALVGNDLYVANTDAVVRFPYTPGADAHRARRRRQGGRPAGRPAQPPLDQEPHRQPRRQQALRDGRLEQQRRRERHGGRGGPRRDLGGRPRHAASSALFASGLRNPNGMAWEPQTGALWTVVNERDEIGSDLVPDYLTSVQRRRLLRLALELLRPATSTTRVQPPRPGPGGQGDRARLRARPAHRLARPGLLRGRAPARSLRERRLHRPARLLEPAAAQRLQGGLRAVRRTAGRRASRSTSSPAS